MRDMCLCRMWKLCNCGVLAFGFGYAWMSDAASSGGVWALVDRIDVLSKETRY